MVPIEGRGDLMEELRYGNRGSAKPYSQETLQKVFDDVRFGRAFLFPKRVARSVKGLQVSRMSVLVSPKETRDHP